MLHKETVEAGTLELIKRLMRDERLKQFTLVGGTALSLQIGHRISIDIDLFNKRAFDGELLKEYLIGEYKAENIRCQNNAVFGFIDGVKIDLIAHQVPDIRAIVIEEGIRMASLEDIGAMKLNAITRNGTRFKDFVDMYVLLSYRPLEIYGVAFENKYFSEEIYRAVAYHSLTYHKDIVPATIQFMGEELTLPLLAERFKQAVHYPSLVFDKYIAQSQELKQEINLKLKLDKEDRQLTQRPNRGRGYRM